MHIDVKVSAPPQNSILVIYARAWPPLHDTSCRVGRYLKRQPSQPGNEVFVEKVTLINVKRVMNAITERSTILKEMVDKDEIAIIGGMHDLISGEVQFTA